MRNQRGITLVALVVTIVVLLILAGTSIAMLQGDNGIITNAQKSAAANTEGQVRENIKNAYNTIKMEVISKTSTDPDYDLSANQADLALTFAKEVLADTSLTSIPATETDGYTITYDSSTSTIKVVFTDETFKSGKKVAGVTMGTIEATATFENGGLGKLTFNPSDPYFK